MTKEKEMVTFSSGAVRGSDEVYYRDFDMKFVKDFGYTEYTLKELTTDSVIEHLMVEDFSNIKEVVSLDLAQAAELLAYLGNIRVEHVPLIICDVFEKGRGNYTRDNWKAGFPLTNCINHAIDHIRKWRNGDKSEPHMEHAITNLYMAWWFVENGINVTE